MNRPPSSFQQDAQARNKGDAKHRNGLREDVANGFDQVPLPGCKGAAPTVDNSSAEHGSVTSADAEPFPRAFNAESCFDRAGEPQHTTMWRCGRRGAWH
mmetsp:Transcript_20666/g.57625  ORF Transcript_20666/g.57625 Transcript_20666/m.57625 type:complete len:99 (-) Transcript_20666:56-352(-)